IGQLIADRLVNICGAQHRDLTQGRTANISLEDYDQVVAGKTGQIDGTACEVGALLAGASRYRDLWRSLGAERAIAEQLDDNYRIGSCVWPQLLPDPMTGSGAVEEG